jgi:2-polyprenyl-3-methyl-5-hydroxy-6-metoxy-1,4-benzoquinol methylase
VKQAFDRNANRHRLHVFDNSDESWRRYGRQDPYYGVLSAERFRTKNLTAESLQEFFDSGAQHIEETLHTATQYLNGGISMGSALDFGCGVGRLVLPLARRFTRVAGIDISSDYIAEARRNCEREGLTNVEFAHSVTALGEAGHRFDFVHSCIVFNHIPWTHGRVIIGQLFGLLNPGGVMAIGVLHRQDMSGVRRLARKARKFLPLHWLINLVRGRPVFEPLMQSNEYPLDELLPLLHRLSARGFHIQPHANEKNEHWAVVFCRREPV